MDFSSKYTLTHHTKAVNVLASQSLVSSEMIQEIFTPAAGYISAIIWMDIDNHRASDGNIQVYERSNDALFTFQSTTMGHSGAVESLAWDPVHWCLPDKQLYVARTVHFYYNGASLLVSYLESGEMSAAHSILDFTVTLIFRFCYSIEPWDLKWRKKVQGRIGNAVLEGSFLLVSNLKDRVDKYTVPTTQCIQSFNHVILCNVPLQISVAQQEFGLDKLLFARIDRSFDFDTLMTRHIASICSFDFLVHFSQRGGRPIV
ncbi:uncharacterized protein EDB91DRAFT_1081213 [Suillus paluster]|uniref:uncharacterized protein n=1 Tax=Suillus paluster TaxID=48578 RepID=UPI001B87B572|nr:uncharacterized protein EDB91DRAFT_1081213 [Suillus paluster]KAG1743277.1 hypothetical protein EDB91DRAFT_1081213 [Suillus paluster]